MGLLWSLWCGPDGALATPPNVHGRQCWDLGPEATWGHANTGFPHKVGRHLQKGYLQLNIWQNSEDSSPGEGIRGRLTLGYA